MDKKVKSNAIRTKDTTQRDKIEGTGEKRNIKNIPIQDQTMQTQKDLPKQRKKILPASKKWKYEDIAATRCKVGKRILEQSMTTERA